MTTDLSSIRTLQDVINVLNIVYFNMNEIEKIYYDMFINPQELDVTFQRYDEEGRLEKITLPNRAKDKQDTITGYGSPEGVVEAGIGKFYIDLSESILYFKGQGGTSAYGWVEVITDISGEYLTPTGDASQLKNLNMSNAGSGILSVTRGGTGTGNISGVIKGNGTNPYSAAIDGTDFMGPISTTGIICYYPIATIPTGWFMCDGRAVSRTTYSRLFNVIGITYGEGNGTTTFNIPNLMNDSSGNSYFIRCWDGERAFNEVQQGQVGAHTHALSGNTGLESEHTHTKGNMEIEGSLATFWCGGPTSASGAFDFLPSGGSTYGGGSSSGRGVDFKASRTWVGNTSAGSPHSHPLTGNTAPNATVDGTENRVLNKMLVPIIKY